MSMLRKRPEFYRIHSADHGEHSGKVALIPVKGKGLRDIAFKLEFYQPSQNDLEGCARAILTHLQEPWRHYISGTVKADSYVRLYDSNGGYEEIKVPVFLSQFGLSI